MTDNAYRKALERLVKALTVQDEDSDTDSQIDALEEALSYACLALGTQPQSHDVLLEHLDNLAIRLLLDRVYRKDLQVYQVQINDNEDKHLASLFMTVDPKLSAQFKRTVQAVQPATEAQQPSKEKAAGSTPGVRDYSIN